MTRLLVERLPRGRVIAADVSEEMLESARRYLDPDFGGRVEYLLTDLLALDLEKVADVIFSTATFHWIKDQPRLFGNLARALKPGGRLLAQMGGKGNLDRIHARSEAIMAQPAYRADFAGWPRPWEFPDEATTRQRLRDAGFSSIEVERFPQPTTFSDEDSFRRFITTVNFRLHLQRIADADLRRQFIERLVEASVPDDPPFTLDYWRLNLSGLAS